MVRSFSFILTCVSVPLCSFGMSTWSGQEVHSTWLIFQTSFEELLNSFEANFDVLFVVVLASWWVNEWSTYGAWSARSLHHTMRCSRRSCKGSWRRRRRCDWSVHHLAHPVCCQTLETVFGKLLLRTILHSSLPFYWQPTILIRARIGPRGVNIAYFFTCALSSLFF